MLKKIDAFLNRVTMYWLLIYSLIFLLTVAFGLSLAGILSFQPVDILIQAFFITAVCYAANALFAFVFEAPSNVESVYITALILALIITPQNTVANLIFMAWASVLAMSSKYILAIGKKHIFNPAALAMVLTALALNESASWWVGNSQMAPFVLLAGLLIVRKIKRADMVISFFMSAILSLLYFNLLKGGDAFAVIMKTFISSPIMFFAFVMLTEPMTTPPTRSLRIGYGVLTGLIFAPAVHIGQVFSTPELVLVVGNIASYLASPKQKLVLKLKEKLKVAEDSYDFVFEPDKKMDFRPGQYMEWTLGHDRPDNRGIRRFFTIASAPSEKNLRLGVKFYSQSSSFKKSLKSLEPGERMVASQLAGDFYMPLDKSRKLAFIAGGIGITPFRSMIQSLLHDGEKRDIVLFYANKQEKDIAYSEVFNQAQKDLGIKVYYALTEEESIPPDWKGVRGQVSQALIEKTVPDYRERLFYISGPHSMVDAYKESLLGLGLRRKQIKSDYFPGFV